MLGGDGTHRAVVTACGDVPIAGISTGTNNAFPEHREPTITGLAVGLAVTGKVPPSDAFLPNKKIVVRVNGHEEIALVDVAVVTERYIGARALWRTETFRELFVTFADPEVIGMSAIAGLLTPVTRLDPHGLHVRLAPEDEADDHARYADRARLHARHRHPRLRADEAQREVPARRSPTARSRSTASASFPSRATTMSPSSSCRMPSEP